MAASELYNAKFPFLFGGTFIEGLPGWGRGVQTQQDFPSFSEGLSLRALLTLTIERVKVYFPSFSEGLSLRVSLITISPATGAKISLPFRRDFH